MIILDLFGVGVNMKIFKIIYYIFLGFFSIIAVLLIVSVFPITGNIKFMTVKSGSMEPNIKLGSVVLVKPNKDYKIGDVITFKPEGETEMSFTHRLYQIKMNDGQTRYITKGDANNGPDQREVLEKEIIGKVLFSVPFLGRILEAVRKPFGFMLVIIIPSAIIIFDEIKKIWQELSKKTKKP